MSQCSTSTISSKHGVVFIFNSYRLDLGLAVVTVYAMNQGFLTIAFSKTVVRNALKVSLVVGTILALINHGAGIASLSLSTGNIVQIALTYLVPYCVSSYSAVRAFQAASNTNEI